MILFQSGFFLLFQWEGSLSGEGLFCVWKGLFYDTEGLFYV